MIEHQRTGDVSEIDTSGTKGARYSSGIVSQMLHHVNFCFHHNLCPHELTSELRETRDGD